MTTNIDELSSQKFGRLTVCACIAYEQTTEDEDENGAPK